MNREKSKKSGIYLLFAFISIIFFYISINVLYTQTSAYYDETFINNLPNAERFVSKIKISTSNTNNNIVLIEWEGITDDNLIYYVYRSQNPIIGKSSFSNSTVVDYVKATNDSKMYVIADSPIITSTYYYAVVSYINDSVFYNAKENIDTSYLAFNGITTNNVLNNNLKYNTNINNNTVVNNIIYTNTVTVTNTITLTNNIINNSKPSGSGSINNNSSQSEYSRYKNQYDRALAQFKLKNYSQAASILEPISRRNINRNLYYDINLLLGKCYKYLGRKKNSLDVFNRIKSYNTQEVNFWINQVLTDL
ncbi:tetratricopeptide repeat protein [Brachyspira hyodysenteriae]|uniref:tetratricopeptide repeat protein n=1 Tax=Brachyspira hyodysenteriae TaxID=159 RepID=UPI00063DC011|nr:hypothetical protein [Brachyspira hyodysenteriae]KLI22088.1 hypothetical protein SU43_09385 [Brachyspira hyodysenteriae]KLI56199.1 hypothetical protein SZ43_00505 [Brachyspira hyodysenteriae]MDA0080220.1 hypothetical protein [Brachyspira hyodysenteriae]QTM08181.1 hypothetical protein GQX60_04675 [Brachyspira hyodysenteriae]TVL42079.1 hypothetical protein A9X84_12080 [Brachyspira hyodysenteriae]